MSVPTTRKLPLHQRGDWFVLEIRGERDIPGYDPEQVGKGLTESAFRREVLGDWTAAQGKLVYPEFGPIHIAEKPLKFDPSRPLVCGWDFGGTPVTGTPAFMPTQVNVYGQWLIFPAVVPAEDETVGIYTFCEWVAQHLYERFAQPRGLELEDLKLVHYGDPAGKNRPPKTRGVTNDALELRSAYKIIKDGLLVPTGETDARGEPVYEELPGWGWEIQGGVVHIAPRLEAVRARLSRNLKGGLPALVVCSEATTIQDAFQGGYHYKERADGTYELEPNKNHYSHPMNALEYVASKLFATKQTEDDDEDKPYREKFRSHGARRHRG